MRDLNGQVAVVTGASSGVGKAIALGLAQQGVNLCIVGREPETLETVARTARAYSSSVSCYQADLGKDAQIQRLATIVQADHGSVNILIHSAGVFNLARTECASIEDFDRNYRLNLRAPYLLTQALLPILRASLGQIVFINSSAGLTARTGVGQYAATKHGLKAIADSLREEINPDGVRILSVFLGRTATPMQAMVHEIERKPYKPEHLLQPEDVASVVINALTLPRTAEVTDISIRPLIKTY